MDDKKVKNGDDSSASVPEEINPDDTKGDERVREGYEDAAHPEPQGDGDPSPLDVTES